MLSFFTLNDPLRLVALGLLVFILKISVFINPIAYPETIHWFTIGEAMQQGSMYVDIWDGLAPISATTYMIITWLFGRSLLTLLILGSILTFLQALIINSFSIKAKLFENNSNLPALAYVLLTSTNPTLFMLSPALMGLTLILLGLGKLLSHVEFRAKKDMHIIMMGLYFGSAILFYLPYIFIIPISLILLKLFSNTIIRRYFLLLFSSLIPLAFSYFYYWLISDHPAYFINNFILINHFDVFYPSVSWVTTLRTLSFALFFLLVGILSFGKQRRLTNYQNRIMQLFLVFGVLLCSVLLLEKPISSFGLVFAIPIASFFTVHFISLFKRKIYRVILSAFLLLGPPTILWAYSTSALNPTISTPVKSTPKEFFAFVKDKKLMILGSGKDLYNEAKLAGPFYDWGLSQQFFKELDHYDNLVFLQSHLKKDPPEIILDLNHIWIDISEKLPEVGRNYILIKPSVWRLKK